MALTPDAIIKLLSKHAEPKDHMILINGEQKGTCTHASFRVVFSLTGVEFPVDYTYVLDEEPTNLRSRVRREGLAAGGHEQILVNGKDVDHDDLLVGLDDSAGTPGLFIEFKYTESGADKRVKFVAPLTAFH
jgi:hypothetical protein